MRNQYLKLKLKSYFQKNRLDPFDTIIELMTDKDSFKSIELCGKISEDYRDVIEMCEINERTFFRIIKKHGKKVGHIVDKFGHSKD